MSRNARNRLGAAIFLGAVVVGCAASKGSSGSGGSPAAGTGGADPSGTGGADVTGSGGTSATGSGGATVTGLGGSTVTGVGGVGGGGGANVPLALVCPSTVKNKGVCITDTDLACANGCGPSKAGFKNCNCFSNVWDCPMCEYLPGDYSCYKLPVPPAACPMDAVDPLALPQAGTACTAPPCTPCGSSTLNSYRDSAGSLKAGYCVCVPGTDTPKWSCASVSEWPPQQ